MDDFKSQHLTNLLNGIDRIDIVEREYLNIISKYSRNNKYEDPDFHPKKNIHEKNDLLKDIKWERLETFYKSQIFRNINTNGIMQGGLGDCYLVSTFIFISEHPELVCQLFHKNINIESGCLCVYFYCFGKRIPFIIDTLIPFYFASPKFSSLRNMDDSAWFCYVEKAYAKMYGCYSGVESGSTVYAFYRLFGWSPRYIDIEEYSDESYDNVEDYYKKGSVIGCPISETPKNYTKEHFKKVGLVSEHFYMCIDMKRESDEKYIKLRNPWGTFEWKGNNSEETDCRTDELKEALKPQNEGDGSFWMKWKDFCKFFNQISISIPPLNAFTETISGVFNPGINDDRSPFSGGSYCGCLDQWTIHFDKPSRLYITAEFIGESTTYYIALEKKHGEKIINAGPEANTNSFSLIMNGCDFQIDDVSSPWTFVVSRKIMSTTSKFFIRFEYLHPLMIKPIKNPCYEKMTQEKFSLTLSPGPIDGKNIFSDDNQLSGLPQWKIVLNNPEAVYLKVWKSRPNSRHIIVFQPNDKKIDFANKQCQTYLIESESEYEEFKFNVDQHSKSYFLVFSREAFTEPSSITFEVFSKSQFQIIRYPDIFDGRKYQKKLIRGDFPRIIFNENTPNMLGKSLSCNRQWTISIDEDTDFLLNFKKNGNTSHHIFLVAKDNIDNHVGGITTNMPYMILHSTHESSFDSYHIILELSKSKFWSVIVTKEHYKEESSYELEILSIKSIQLFQTPYPDFEKDKKYSGKLKLVPGWTDNRKPFKDDSIHCLNQWRFFSNNQTTIFLLLKKKCPDVLHYLFFQEGIDNKIERFYQDSTFQQLISYGNFELEMFPITIPERKPCVLAITRESSNDISHCDFTVFCEAPVLITELPVPNYNDLYKVSIENFLFSGPMDNRTPIGIDRMVSVLQQYILGTKDNKDFEAIINIENNLSNHYLYLIQATPNASNIGVLTQKDIFKRYEFSPHNHKISFAFDLPIHSYWIIVFCRDSQVNNSKICFELYSKFLPELKPIPLPKYSSLNSVSIVGSFQPGENDDRDGYNPNKSIDILPQYQIEINRGSVLYFSFNGENIQSEHTICLCPATGKKMRYITTLTKVFSTKCLMGLDRWEWNTDESTNNWIICVYRSSSDTTSTYQLDVFSSSSIKMQPLGGDIISSIRPIIENQETSYSIHYRDPEECNQESKGRNESSISCINDETNELGRSGILSQEENDKSSDLYPFNEAQEKEHKQSEISKSDSKEGNIFDDSISIDESQDEEHKQPEITKSDSKEENIFDDSISIDESQDEEHKQPDIIKSDSKEETFIDNSFSIDESSYQEHTNQSKAIKKSVKTVLTIESISINYSDFHEDKYQTRSTIEHKPGVIIEPVPIHNQVTITKSDPKPWVEITTDPVVFSINEKTAQEEYIPRLTIDTATVQYSNFDTETNSPKLSSDRIHTYPIKDKNEKESTLMKDPNSSKCCILL